MQLRGLLWLVSGLVVALVAGFVAFATLNRVAQQPVTLSNSVSQGAAAVQLASPSTPTQPVVVAVAPIAARTLITGGMLELRQMPVDVIPEGAVESIFEAEGKISATDLYAGEVLMAQRLVEPNHRAGDGRTALLLEEDMVLMAVPAGDLMSRIGILKPGDRVDLLVSIVFEVERLDGETKDIQKTWNLLQDMVISAIVGGTVPAEATSPQNPDALLLALDPQDAVILKYAIDADGVIDIVLRAPDQEGIFDVAPVDAEYLNTRYRLIR
jgi:pilus assembly protein CpaB